MLQKDNFEQSVKVILAIFTVFTGYTIGKAVDLLTKKIPISISDWELSSVVASLDTFFHQIVRAEQFWGLLVLLSLFLRYIIGSAIHLNYTYVKSTDAPNAPAVQSLMLFKDLIFLVIFGIVALSITTTLGLEPNSTFDFPGLAFGAMLFLAFGLLWSLSDAIIRGILAIFNCSELPRRTFLIWIILDAGQLSLTWWYLVSHSGSGVLSQAKTLAILYLGFLLADVISMIYWLVPRAAPVAPRGTIEFEVTPQMIAAGRSVLVEAHNKGQVTIDPNNTQTVDAATLAAAVIAATFPHIRGQAP